MAALSINMLSGLPDQVDGYHWACLHAGSCRQDGFAGADDGEFNGLAFDCQAAVICRDGEIGRVQVAGIGEIFAEMGAARVFARKAGLGDHFGHRHIGTHVQPIMPGQIERPDCQGPRQPGFANSL